jgi:hypothetical protein
MNKVGVGRLTSPAMIAPIADQWWVISCVVDARIQATAGLDFDWRSSRGKPHLQNSDAVTDPIYEL